jgi:hypothetical protein
MFLRAINSVQISGLIVAHQREDSTALQSGMLDWIIGPTSFARSGTRLGWALMNVFTAGTQPRAARFCVLGLYERMKKFPLISSRLECRHDARSECFGSAGEERKAVLFSCLATVMEIGDNNQSM